MVVIGCGFNGWRRISGWALIVEERHGSLWTVSGRCWPVALGDVGDVGGGFESAAQLLIFQGESLDVRHGQVEVLGEVLVARAQAGVLAVQPLEGGAANSTSNNATLIAPSSTPNATPEQHARRPRRASAAPSAVQTFVPGR